MLSSLILIDVVSFYLQFLQIWHNFAKCLHVVIGSFFYFVTRLQV